MSAAASIGLAVFVHGSDSLITNASLLFLIGAMIAGPDSVLSGAGVADVCEQRGVGTAAVSTASGFVVRDSAPPPTVGVRACLSPSHARCGGVSVARG
jgi:hypothetical protein